MTFDPRDLTKAFEGLEFPTSRDAILQRAADTGGLSGEVQEVLDLIPVQTYESADDLEEAVSLAYIEHEGLTTGMPVTPAAPAPKFEKDAAAAGAETEEHSAA